MSGFGMGSKATGALPLEEVERLNREDEDDPGSVKNLNRLPEKALKQAKAGLGSALREAIGTNPLKTYGTEGMIGGVVSGEKVPDYLASIYADPAARRRLAKALVKGDKKVRRYTVLEFEDEEEKAV